MDGRISDQVKDSMAKGDYLKVVDTLCTVPIRDWNQMSKDFARQAEDKYQVLPSLKLTEQGPQLSLSDRIDAKSAPVGRVTVDSRTCYLRNYNGSRGWESEHNHYMKYAR